MKLKLKIAENSVVILIINMGVKTRLRTVRRIPRNLFFNQD